MTKRNDKSRRSNINLGDVYSGFSILSMSDQEITSKIDHAISEVDRFHEKSSDSYKKSVNQNRATDSSDRNTRDSQSSSGRTYTSGNSNYDKAYQAFSGKGPSSSDMLKKAGTTAAQSGISALAGGGGGGAALKSAMSGFKGAIDPTTLALTLLAEGAKAAYKALKEYSTSSLKFSNMMMSQYSLNYAMTERYQSDANYAKSSIGTQWGSAGIISQKDVERVGERFLPQFKTMDYNNPFYESSLTTALKASKTGVSIDEQYMRMLKETSRQSFKDATFQLERMDKLVNLSQIGNMSLGELVDLQSSEQEVVNKTANQMINSGMNIEDAVYRSDQLQDFKLVLDSVLREEGGASSSTSKTITDMVQRIANGSVDQLADLARILPNSNPIDLQQKLLSGDQSTIFDASMEIFEGFRRQGTTLHGYANLGSTLRMSGLGDERTADAIMALSPTINSAGFMESAMAEAFNKLDQLQEKPNSLDDLMTDYYRSPKDQIMGAIDESAVGVWAKNASKSLTHKLGGWIGDGASAITSGLFGGSSTGTSNLPDIYGNAGLNSSNSLNSPRTTGKLFSWLLGKNPTGDPLGGPRANLGVGGGRRDYVDPKTGLDGVGAYTLTAGYRDPWYTKKFGNVHRGIDYGAPSGTPILSTTGGVVETVEHNNGKTGYGNLVTVRDSNNYLHKYAHMVKGSFRVAKGQSVLPGQILGGVGTTGNSTGNHLHYEVNAPSGGDVDPNKWVPGLFGQAINVGLLPQGDASATQLDSIPGGLTEIPDTVYRSSLLGLVRRGDGSGFYSGVGGAGSKAVSQGIEDMNRSMSNDNRIVQSILRELKEMTDGRLSGVQGALAGPYRSPF